MKNNLNINRKMNITSKITSVEDCIISNLIEEVKNGEKYSYEEAIKYYTFLLKQYGK
ncbi:MAG: hypothetical protein K1X86_12390 [Ignavibacteria bacterium]|nr:hypothetical protein [Ignavibacteria bacterium]